MAMLRFAGSELEKPARGADLSSSVRCVDRHSRPRSSGQAMNFAGVDCVSHVALMFDKFTTNAGSSASSSTKTPRTSSTSALRAAAPGAGSRPDPLPSMALRSSSEEMGYVADASPSSGWLGCRGRLHRARALLHRGGSMLCKRAAAGGLDQQGRSPSPTTEPRQRRGAAALLEDEGAIFTPSRTPSDRAPHRAVEGGDLERAIVDALSASGKAYSIAILAPNRIFAAARSLWLPPLVLAASAPRWRSPPRLARSI